jgi:L-amino acid N-acyltransferase YncA
MTRCQALLDVWDVFLATKNGYKRMVAGIFRQRYPECKIALKVLRRPLTKMAL